LLHLLKRGLNVRMQQPELAEQQDIPARRIDMERTGVDESIAISATDLSRPVEREKQQVGTGDFLPDIGLLVLSRDRMIHPKREVKRRCNMRRPPLVLLEDRGRLVVVVKTFGPNRR
jgi:hypothetical protein